MKLQKREIDELTSESITKKKYDETLAKIDERVHEIVVKMAGGESKYRWYDYDNEDGEGRPGCFDPSEYNEWIVLTGENSTFHLHITTLQLSRPDGYGKILKQNLSIP